VQSKHRGGSLPTPTPMPMLMLMLTVQHMWSQTLMRVATRQTLTPMRIRAV
jgi:hypothetical protein